MHINHAGRADAATGADREIAAADPACTKSTGGSAAFRVRGTPATHEGMGRSAGPVEQESPATAAKPRTADAARFAFAAGPGRDFHFKKGETRTPTWSGRSP